MRGGIGTRAEKSKYAQQDDNESNFQFPRFVHVKLFLAADLCMELTGAEGRSGGRPGGYEVRPSNLRFRSSSLSGPLSFHFKYEHEPSCANNDFDPMKRILPV